MFWVPFSMSITQPHIDSLGDDGDDDLSHNHLPNFKQRFTSLCTSPFYNQSPTLVHKTGRARMPEVIHTKATAHLMWMG